MPPTTKKMIGDAGEHYAISRFMFNDVPAVKMPDNWPEYDLAIDRGQGLESVSVKTRTETGKWSENQWFEFDDSKKCALSGRLDLGSFRSKLPSIMRTL